MKKRWLWLFFALYTVITGYTVSNHELWGDEVHSWNISKGSGSYANLIDNRRFEGHPPGWYTVLWTISRFSHNMAWMQIVQWIFACAVAFMLLFYSPFPLLTRLLIPFGYFFLFEYAVFSRNYIIGILLIFSICLIMWRDFSYKLPLYYALIFLASNMHLLVLMLAGSLHVYFLLMNYERKKTYRWLGLNAVAGILIVLPAMHFIFPPADSALNIHVWLSRWSSHQLAASVDVPLRAFLPVPAWWNYNFWNTQFLVEAKKDYSIFKIVNLLVAIGLVALGFYVLRASIKCLALFGTNLVLTFIMTVALFPLTVTRYAGFVFIGFIASYWLYCYERPAAAPAAGQPSGPLLVNLLLIVHIFTGAFAVIRDIRLPFANLFRVKEFIREVPPGQRLITDYWTMNALVAFTDKPAYCVDIGKTIAYVLWDPDVAALQKNRFRYTSGLQDIFKKEGLTSLYMISEGSPGILAKTDARLFGSYHIDMIDRREGAIEKGSNLYLYKISPL